MVVTALGPLALNILVPSMPGLQRTFDAGYDVVQLVLSLYLVGIAFGQLIYGPLSDRFGRRPILLIGLVIFSIGTIGCLFAPGIEILIGFRVLQAVGGCAGLVLARAIISDLFKREQAASILAYITMAMVLAPMVAPTIGGTLDTLFGWWAGFILILIISMFALLFVSLRLHETHFNKKLVLRFFTPIYDAKRLLSIRSFRGHAFQVAFTTSVFFTFIAGAPFVMIEILGRSPTEYGIHFLMVPSAYITGNFFAGRYTRKVGSDLMIVVGTTIALISTASLLGIYLLDSLTPLVLFAAMGVVGFGNGLCVANGMMGAVTVDTKLIGSASGLAGFLQMGIGAATSFLVGSLMQTTALPLLIVMFAGASLAMLSHCLGVISTKSKAIKAGG